MTERADELAEELANELCYPDFAERARITIEADHIDVEKEWIEREQYVLELSFQHVNARDYDE